MLPRAAPALGQYGAKERSDLLCVKERRGCVQEHRTRATLDRTLPPVEVVKLQIEEKYRGSPSPIDAALIDSRPEIPSRKYGATGGVAPERGRPQQCETALIQASRGFHQLSADQIVGGTLARNLPFLLYMDTSLSVKTGADCPLKGRDFGGSFAQIPA